MIVVADVIETVLMPYVLDRPFPDGLHHFQQDGAPVHTANIAESFWAAFSEQT